MTYHQLAGIGAVANAVIGLATLSPLHLAIAAVVATALWMSRT